MIFIKVLKVITVIMFFHSLVTDLIFGEAVKVVHSVTALPDSARARVPAVLQFLNLRVAVLLHHFMMPRLPYPMMSVNTSLLML